MDALGQTGAVASVIISLDAIRAGARRAIEMDRDEGGAAIGVCDSDSRPQRNENIAVASHDHTIPVGLQNPLEPLGHIQRLVFLADPLPGNPAAIKSAVTGIDNNGA